MKIHLPSGTVAFLFSDIEGSTPRWESQPEVMSLAVARHHQILREAIAASAGVVFKIIGDEFQSAYATAGQGLSAALEIQRRLAEAEWPGETGAIRVRMGLHVGPAELDESGDYAVSHTLNRTARVMSAGHGGQILLSQEAADLVERRLPAGVSLKDVGEHRLKGLSIPEHLYQVLAPGLAASFPPLRTLDSLPNNLPLQLTSFIGREQELAEIRRLLSDGPTHLVTLTGSGGTGKTRLALQAAAELVETFAEGAWLVELAPLADPELVAEAAARALDVRETPGRSHTEAVCDFLRAKQVLLILDNCEHVVLASAQFVSSVLQASPGLRILATSREVLGVEGETAYRVPSLAAPGAGEHPDLQTLAQFDAVRLFVERARAASPGFELSEANGSAVGEISRRLDGIPLALELAAARVRLLGAGQISVRLGDAFRLLTGGSRTVLPRHQTLRAMIDWSYNLLSEEERRLLRELAVFAGGWTLEAAEAICSDCDVLGLLGQLVDKSLVISSGGEEPRLRMLETIRQYAQEKLVDAGEAGPARERHLGYFLAWVERIEPELRGREQVAYLQQVDQELDNLRLALGWALQTDPEAELRLASALKWYWTMHGHVLEGAEWHEQGLAQAAAPGIHPRVRAKALAAAGCLHAFARRANLAKERLEESLRLNRELGEEGKRGLALALFWIGGIEKNLGNLAQAETCVREAHSLYQEVSDPLNYCDCLSFLNDLLWSAETGSQEARRLAEECLALRIELGDLDGMATANNDIGYMALTELDLARAQPLLEQSVKLYQQVGNEVTKAGPIIGLGKIALLRGNFPLALVYFQQAVEIQRTAGKLYLLANNALTPLWDLYLVLEKNELARQCSNETQAQAKKSGSNYDTGWAQYSLAVLAWLEGDDIYAQKTITDALARMRAEYHFEYSANFYIKWGSLLCQGGDPAEAASVLLEGIRYFGQTRNWAEMALGVDGLARLAASGQPERAARLFGIAEHMNPYLVNILYPLERAGREAAMTQVKQALGEEQMEAGWTEGKTMPLEQAVVYALQEMEA